MKNSTPLVAINCITYNHEPYIRQCLEGFVMQKTDFSFVAIVHDDASTDGTAAIIKEYAEKYPDIIKPIYETENQYSKKDGSLDKIMTQAILCTGCKYIAICEGDDYWTDSDKLQRQIDFLDNNLEYVAVAENAIVYYLLSDKKAFFSTKETRDITLKEIVTKRVFPTASVVYRATFQIDFINTCKYKIDTILWAYLAKHGKIRYFDQVSSVYNRGKQGVVLGSNPYKWLLECENWNNELAKLCVNDFSTKFFKKRIRKESVTQLLRCVKSAKIKTAIKILLRYFKYL